MTKYFCDRCGKECQKLTEIRIPFKKISCDSFETRPIKVCYECKKEFDNIIDKLIDIRLDLFNEFMGANLSDDEYIKREDVLKAITYVGTAPPTDIIPLTLLTARKKIMNIPTADVAEIVRCKDCTHRNPHGYKCLRDNLWHDDDDFCSYGERKPQQGG